MKRCTRCGDRIDTAEWYPVTVGDDRILPFCSEDCLESWDGTARQCE